MSASIITLLTDFGAGSGYPAQMKGVILGLHPGATLVDLSHEVPAYRVLVGQALLLEAAAAFPPGTIHVAVVDPGVGTSRRGLVVSGGDKAPGQLFVGPDNGLLWPFVRNGRAWELSNPALRRPEVAPTFHGRDVFAPAAAHLALGLTPEQFGPEVLDPVRLQPPRVRREGGAVVGEIVHVDTFGNLISNLSREDLPPTEAAALKVSIGGRTLSGVQGTYASVPAGSLVALMGSAGFLEIAVREGSAARELRLEDGQGMPVVVEEA
ncbi:MAG: SAM-dependent chlorinase/fluorinase [Deltaproteobacteria bacterium]|nr:SAM-dependent chlorinase/fluorinase [Deltaproteobacteria bacterium]